MGHENIDGVGDHGHEELSSLDTLLQLVRAARVLDKDLGSDWSILIG